MIKGMKLKNKRAAAFGSYGWSGEAVKLITEQLKSAGMQIVNEGIRCIWTPDEKAQEDCIKYGEELA